MVHIGRQEATNRMSLIELFSLFFYYTKSINPTIKLKENHRKGILPFLGKFVLHALYGSLKEKGNKVFTL